MTDTFTPPHGVDFGSLHTPTARLNSATFGDGYEQNTPDGLNYKRDLYQVSYTGDIVSIKAARDWLKGKNGTEPFYWTPPDENTPGLFKCDLNSIQYRIAGHNHRVLTAVFREVFDLV